MWSVIVGVIALVGLIVLAAYAVSLARKASAVGAEIEQLSACASEVRTLLGQLELQSDGRD